MTDEQINIAIAESLGWTNCRLAIKGAGGGTRYPTAHGMPPNRKYESSCPNYTADLNACHELEKTLDDKQLARYAQQIIGSARRKMNIPDHESHYPVPFIISATARQRCEAYLKTIGKWKESHE
jgi:hypothetical protein